MLLRKPKQNKNIWSTLVSLVPVYKIFYIHWQILRFTNKQENVTHNQVKGDQLEQTHGLPWLCNKPIEKF